MSDRIVCKPTPWFLLRAAAMLVMFGVFTVMFFADGKWGYREKNLAYHVEKAFATASAEFRARHQELGPEGWRTYAARQTVTLPEDRSVLPESTQVPLPWPEVLSDFDILTASLEQPEGWLFDAHRPDFLRKDPPDHDYSAQKILEQWVVFWICLALTVGALIVLLRTVRRCMAIDDEALYPVGGGRVLFGDLVRLDLRKWGGKGLAYAWARTADGGERRLRIDGLTYGGFKVEDGEPAERLMRRLRENFSGEVIDYEIESGEPGGSSAASS